MNAKERSKIIEILSQNVRGNGKSKLRYKMWEQMMDDENPLSSAEMCVVGELRGMAKRGEIEEMDLKKGTIPAGALRQYTPNLKIKAALDEEIMRWYRQRMGRELDEMMMGELNDDENA